jgi:hypothetical protein
MLLFIPLSCLCRNTPPQHHRNDAAYLSKYLPFKVERQRWRIYSSNTLTSSMEWL